MFNSKYKGINYDKLSEVMTENIQIIPLEGHVTKRLSRRKLPTNRQVLSLVFFKHKPPHVNVHQTAAITIDEVMNIWKNSNIPMNQRQHNIQKLEKLHQQWKNLRKSASRKSSTVQKSKERDFKKKLNELFDISPKKASDSLTESQRSFLEDQRRTGHRSTITLAEDPVMVFEETADTSSNYGNQEIFHSL